MSPAKALAIGGLLSAAVATAGGFLDIPALLGAAGAVMLVANVAALVLREPGAK